MNDYQLRRLYEWVATHGVDCNLNAEDGYIVIYTPVALNGQVVGHEVDRARTLADARAILGY